VIQVVVERLLTGEGAVGEDPANLIIDSVTDGLMDAALLPEIVDANNHSWDSDRYACQPMIATSTGASVWSRL